MPALASLHRHDIPTCLGRLCVYDSGGNGTPMLFWSSLLMSASMWQAQAEHFAGRYRVLLIDPPGHGDSEALRRHFDFDECARCLVEILDHLGLERAHFVGNSWGGMIGATFAALYPQRLATAVLMNATASPAGFKHKLEFPVLAMLARLLGLNGVLKRLVVGNFVGPTSEAQRPHVLASIGEALQHCRPDSVAWAVSSVVPRRPDQRVLLRSISRPVLVIAGEEDRVFPVAETRAMAEAIPGAELVVMAYTAHLAGLENPQEVNLLIDAFLARHAAGASEFRTDSVAAPAP